VKLKSLLLSKPQYGANEAGLVREHKEQVRYIRITDIDENGLISTDELGATVANLEEKYILNENDIVIARSGATVGKAYIHRHLPYTCVCAGYLIRFVVDSDKILPDYLFAYTQLNPYKEWVNAIQRPSAQPNINAEEYQSLEIPLPNLSKQQEIVDFINEAYTQKRAKEVETQQLLDSIDNYLLKELGITIPEVKTDIGSRMFIVQRSELKERYTPGLYKDAISLHSTIYDNIPLSHLAYINPNTRLPHKDEKMMISFIPMESVNEIYAEINDNKNCIVAESKGFTRFQEGDLLWAKITPCMENGKSAIAKDLINGYGCGSTEFHVIRPKNSDLLVEYILSLLHTRIVRQTAKLYFGGSAGQQRVANDFLESFNVPLPSKTKQQEIVDYISNIRTRAKALQAEGKAILEDAKRKVEEMIIGE
jgi:type I restriction enzyme S subunit